MKYCDKCNGTGFEIKENPETKEKIAHPCDCRVKQDSIDLMNRRLKASDIPTKYWNYTIDDYKDEPFDPSVHAANKKSIQNLEHIINTPEDFLRDCNVLWIWGKERIACHTILAVTFATQLLKKGYKVKFLLMQKFLDMFTDFDGKQEYFRALDDVDVFLIDNAFMSTTCIAKEYTAIHLYNWLLDMLTHNKYFICTSKNSIEEIDKIFELCKFPLLKYAFSLEFQGSLVDSEDKRKKLIWEK